VSKGSNAEPVKAGTKGAENYYYIYYNKKGETSPACCWAWQVVSPFVLGSNRHAAAGTRCTSRDKR